MPSEDDMISHHLTPAHFHAFGYIISTYAKIEQGFKAIISGITGLDVNEIAIMTEPYSSMQLRNVITSMSEFRPLPDRGNEQLKELISEFATFSKLRNQIAHSMWTEGNRPDSIKPLNVDIRSGKAKYFGIDEDERDWTIAELDDEAIRMMDFHQKQTQFSLTRGWAPDIAE